MKLLGFTIGILTSLAISASATTHYVDLNCTNPVPPYINWSTAATNIQDAVDVADPGDQILVTNGVYQTGQRYINGAFNRVVVDKALTLQSVSGPAWTEIHGFRSGQAGPSIRCVNLTNGTMLSGFTLGGGGALTGGGGGVWCESSSAIISNCIFNGNHTVGGGGGAYRGTLFNCVLTNNFGSSGGGAFSNILINCLIISNRASAGGGGAYQSTLKNCTIAGNYANLGGGVAESTLTNCIAQYNVPGAGSNYSSSTLSYCCTTPLPSGFGNFTNAPLFVDLTGGDLRLQSSSPCINAGKNSAIADNTDLVGNPRIVGGTVDTGAYEFQTPSSVLSYAWAQKYGLPTDGSADYVDSDIPTGDGMNNWQEWKADTNPTNSQSVLRMTSLSNGLSGVLVEWQSRFSRTYFLERAAGLPSFSGLASNVVGQAGTTTYTDTTATNNGPFFYRVGVQE